MAGLISICIPTRNRPEMLYEAAKSCLRQHYRPLEIVIGDDSDDDRNAQIKDLPLPEGVSLNYTKHSQRRGQAGNVNWLLDQAGGDRLMLLHDDDLLCDGGLDALVRAWDESRHPACVYGKTVLISDDGHVLADETGELNSRYCRTSGYAGAQEIPLAAALRQQVPANGFLMLAALARRVRYRSEREVGNVCVDTDFEIRLAVAAGERSFIFIDEFVSMYRLTRDSVLRARDAESGCSLFFEYLKALEVTPDCTSAKELCLRRHSLDASLDAAKERKVRTALSIILSGYYDRPFFSKWTAYRLGYILHPRVGRLMDRLR
jgi:glycosyltransferase involved in cell wall biosynthesis